MTHIYFDEVANYPGQMLIDTIAKITVYVWFYWFGSHSYSASKFWGHAVWQFVLCVFRWCISTGCQWRAHSTVSEPCTGSGNWNLHFVFCFHVTCATVPYLLVWELWSKCHSLLCNLFLLLISHEKLIKGRWNSHRFYFFLELCGF